MNLRMEAGCLLVVPRLDGSPVWEGKWRLNGRQIKRRLGPAWLVPDDDSYTGSRRATRFDGWLKRSGKPRVGHLTEQDAIVALRRKQAAEAKRYAQLAQDAGPSARFENVALAWLEDRRLVGGAKATTLRDYEAMLYGVDREPRKRGRRGQARLMSRFGGRSVESITTAEVRSWLADLDRDPRLGPRSVNKHRQVLNSIMAFAVEQYGITENPVAGVPKRRQPDPEELIVYTADQVMAIARKTESEQDAAMIVAAAFTGMRQSEVLELRWRDANFSGERLHVQRGRSAGLPVSTPKSRKGRSIPLAPQVAEVLAKLGQRPHYTGANDLVFPGATGKHLDPSTVRSRYTKARDAAREDDPHMPIIRFHDLRHTFGSLLAMAGIDVLTIKEYMGHSDLKTTMQYLHFRPSSDDAARLGEAFASQMPDGAVATARKHVGAR